MPVTNFDISTLFQQAFGVGRGTPYDGEQAEVPAITTADGYQAPSVNDEEGTEFVELRSSIKATTPYGQQIFMPVQLGGVLLPNEPTLNIQLVKRIVKTSLTGSTRKGTVKELIGRDDDIVTIRGIALNYASTKVYPEDIVKSLKDLAERNESLPIDSALTNLLGISRLVIERVTFPEMVGVQNAQAYELQCISDEDFDLEIE
jgi:hypothetical protein